MEIETINTQDYNLVGDIGGTNARFALVVPGESELISIKKLSCNKFETVQEAIKSYLSSINNVGIKSSCIASAGTTHLDIFKPSIIYRIQNMGYGVGIMMDDIISGILSLLIVMGLFH